MGGGYGRQVHFAGIWLSSAAHLQECIDQRSLTGATSEQRNRLPSRALAFAKMRHAGNRMPLCPYCRTMLDQISRDHIFPNFMGGSRTIPACAQCNNRVFGARFEAKAARQILGFQLMLTSLGLSRISPKEGRDGPKPLSTKAICSTWRFGLDGRSL